MLKIISISFFCFFTLINAKAQFTLPELKYSYDALEPNIDSLTMRIHHSKHHQAYIDNLNKALSREQQNLGIEDILSKMSSFSLPVRNNAGGHYNHSLFWTLLTPEKNTQLIPNLKGALIKQFISLDSFKKVFVSAGLSQFGSGWVWLIVNKQNKLEIVTTANQDNPLMDDASKKGYPILGIDLWEHAYYLLYQNKRAAYLNSIWDIINWDEVSNRYNVSQNIRR
jgi:Fe-Mn family superoxide dismutase